MTERPFVRAAAPADVGLSGAFLAVLPEGIDSKPALHAALAEALSLPGWYGHNWDALADCLNSLEGLRERRVVLFHRELPALEEEDLETYLSILDEAVRGWRDDGEHELVVSFPPDAKLGPASA